MTQDQDFADWLKTKLVELEWMQKTLSDRSGIPTSNISELMSGKQKLTIETAQRLAQLPELRITASQLLRMAGLMRSSSPLGSSEVALNMYDALTDQGKALALDFMEMLQVRERKQNAKRKKDN